MSNSNGTSSSQTAQAPSWQQPYQQAGLNQALSQYQNTSQLVAPFAPQQEQAISNVTNMATNGDPGTTAAGNYITNTLGGNVQTNPELNSLYNQGAQQIQQGLSSQFAGAGRNVDASAGAQGLADGTFASNLYGGAFNTETGAQTAALSAAPNNLASNLGLQSALYGAGQNVQNLSQNYIQAPQTFLNQYLSQVNGNLGTTQSTPSNTAATTLGGTLLGSSLGSSLSGGSSLGTALGALGGGLLGYL